MDSDHEDARRDALAILSAGLAGDEEGIEAVLVNSNVPMVVGTLAGLLFEVLRDHDVDPAAWVAEQQGRSEP
jgi:hypothetical protein